MARSSLSEDSLVRLEHYLSSNPYREYSMNKPYFPRTSHLSIHSTRQTPQQQSSTLAFHQLLDNSKNSLTLDRLAYKLRMKSDLNIDTLREVDGRRRGARHQRNQPSSSTQNQLNFEVSDITSSLFPSTTTTTTTALKPVTRQAPAMVLSSDAMKTLVNEDLTGIEGNAVHVGTVDDLLKRFRPAEHQIVRRPVDDPDSPSTCASNNVTPNDRAAMGKLHPQHQERFVRQPQALTEYRFKTPTLSSLATRIQRESTNLPALNFQVRTRDQYTSTDNPDVSLLHQCPLNSPEQHRTRFHFPTQQQQDISEMNPHDKRIQDAREKSLMRTEKQSYACNKLTIGDPFSSHADRMTAAIYRLQQSHEQQPPITTNYIFPPVRPFGYFTKKPPNDDSPLVPPGSSSFSPRLRKKHGINKNVHHVSRNVSDMVDRDDQTRTFRGRIKSADTLSDEDNNDVHKATMAVDYNVAGTLLQTTAVDDEP